MRRLSTFARIAACTAALAFAAASSSNKGGGGGGGTVPNNPGGYSDPNAAVSGTYDVKLAIPTSQLSVTNDADGGWTAKTSGVYNGGAVTLSILRDNSASDTFSLANDLANDSKAKGVDTSSIEQDQLVGIPAARWITMQNDVATMVILAKTGSCVYLLIASMSSSKSQDEIVNYFKWARGAVSTASGGQVINAPACR